MIAVLVAGAGGWRWSQSFHNKHVDDVLAAAIDEGGCSLPVEHIEAAAQEGEAFAGKILDRRGEIDFAVEPGLYRVLVGGLNVSQMAGLQGAQVRIDRCCGKGGALRLCAQYVEQFSP